MYPIDKFTMFLLDDVNDARDTLGGLMQVLQSGIELGKEAEILHDKEKFIAAFAKGTRATRWDYTKGKPWYLRLSIEGRLTNGKNTPADMREEAQGFLTYNKDPGLEVLKYPYLEGLEDMCFYEREFVAPACLYCTSLTQHKISLEKFNPPDAVDDLLIVTLQMRGAPFIGTDNDGMPKFDFGLLLTRLSEDAILQCAQLIAPDTKTVVAACADKSAQKDIFGRDLDSFDWSDSYKQIMREAYARHDDSFANLIYMPKLEWAEGWDNTRFLSLIGTFDNAGVASPKMGGVSRMQL